MLKNSFYRKKIRSSLRSYSTIHCGYPGYPNSPVEEGKMPARNTGGNNFQRTWDGIRWTNKDEKPATNMTDIELYPGRSTWAREKWQKKYREGKESRARERTRWKKRTWNENSVLELKWNREDERKRKR